MASQDNADSPNYGSINDRSRPPIHLHASLESLDVGSHALSSLMQSSSSPSRPQDATAGRQQSSSPETMLLTSPLIRRFSHKASFSMGNGEDNDPTSITPNFESIDTVVRKDDNNTKKTKGDSE